MTQDPPKNAPFDARSLVVGHEHVLGTPPAGVFPRRSRRRPIHGTFVALEASSIPGSHYVVDALDINADGIGLVVPPGLEAGSEVTMTFRLEEEVAFAQVRGVVLHHDGQSAGVRFVGWPEHDRLRLLEYLVRFYEEEGQPPARG